MCFSHMQTPFELMFSSRSSPLCLTWIQGVRLWFFITSINRPLWIANVLSIKVIIQSFILKSRKKRKVFVITKGKIKKSYIVYCNSNIGNNYAYCSGGNCGFSFIWFGRRVIYLQIGFAMSCKTAAVLITNLPSSFITRYPSDFMSYSTTRVVWVKTSPSACHLMDRFEFFHK